LSDATTEDGKASGTNTSEPLQVYFSGQFHASVGKFSRFAVCFVFDGLFSAVSCSTKLISFASVMFGREDACLTS
jgi:hypothetical protein